MSIFVAWISVEKNKKKTKKTFFISNITKLKFRVYIHSSHPKNSLLHFTYLNCCLCFLIKILIVFIIVRISILNLKKTADLFYFNL